MILFTLTGYRNLSSLICHHHGLYYHPIGMLGIDLCRCEITLSIQMRKKEQVLPSRELNDKFDVFCSTRARNHVKQWRSNPESRPTRQVCCFWANRHVCRGRVFCSIIRSIKYTVCVFTTITRTSPPPPSQGIPYCINSSPVPPIFLL